MARLQMGHILHAHQHPGEMPDLKTKYNYDRKKTFYRILEQYEITIDSIQIT